MSAARTKRREPMSRAASRMRPTSTNTSMRPAKRVAKKAKVASARASVADAAAGAVAAAAVADASAAASAARRGPRMAAASSHRRATTCRHSIRKASVAAVRARPVTAKRSPISPTCPPTATKSFPPGRCIVPTKHRGRARTSQLRRCARPSPPRPRAVAPARASRAWNASSSGSRYEVSTEDASASSAPARKGWWQRKLGGE